MPNYSPINLDFEPYVGPNPRSTGVFVKHENGEPITGDLGKDWWPENSPRQPYFETQVSRISTYLGNLCIPTHIQWRTGQRNQLDKGCIGHSFVGDTSFIESVARNNRGEITHVIIRETHAPNN